jgi:hypothetical protein
MKAMAGQTRGKKRSSSMPTHACSHALRPGPLRRTGQATAFTGSGNRLANWDGTADPASDRTAVTLAVGGPAHGDSVEHSAQRMPLDAPATAYVLIINQSNRACPDLHR